MESSSNLRVLKRKIVSLIIFSVYSFISLRLKTWNGHVYLWGTTYISTGGREYEQTNYREWAVYICINILAFISSEALPTHLHTLCFGSHCGKTLHVPAWLLLDGTELA